MKHTILLLIEDSPLLTAMYQAALEKADFDVLVAHDGETGLNIAKEKKPSGIILDILMPGMDGYEVLKKIKEDEITKNIKVIILSVVAQKDAQEKAKKLGAADYLIKTDLTLSETIEKIVSFFHGK